MAAVPRSSICPSIRSDRQNATLTILNSTSPIHYRPDLDGLRAIAVLFVILYHLNPGWCPGGFVGVDLFFVISGFVVTRSTVATSDLLPLYAMAGFWRRRILRIVPALLCTTLCSMVLIAALTPPFPIESYRGAVRTGAISLLGFSNWYLRRGALDYFRDDNSSNPFLHTWSLGVEEQFYFVYSLLFLGVLWRHRRLRPIVMLLAAVISMYLFCFSVNVDRSELYFLTQFRFWEIACGSAIAFFEPSLTRLAASINPSIAEWLASLNLALLVFAASISTGADFPRFQITLSVLSGALFVVTGSAGQNWVASFLRFPLLIAIGRRSYSLYLWHFPLYFFWRQSLGLDHFFSIAAANVVLAVLAWVSYSLIEQPFRTLKPNRFRVFPILAAGVLLTFAATYLIQAYPGGIYLGKVQDWSGDWRSLDGQSYLPNGVITSVACDLGNGSTMPVRIPAACSSAPEPARRVLPLLFVVGDSHAYSNWGMVASGKKLNLFDVATLVHDGCTIAEGELTRAPSCEAYWSRMPKWIGETMRPGDTLFLALRWPLNEATESSRLERPLRRVIDAARLVGGHVVLQAPLPVLPRPAYLCTQEWFRRDFSGCFVPRVDAERMARPIRSMLQKLASEYEAVHIWDPLPLVCNSENCGAFSGGMPLFRDTNHLSVYGARSLGRDFVAFWRRTT